jgi:two-component system OmpR family response regulator
VGTNAIEVYVHRVRKKLEPFGVDIRTVRGMGYLLDKAMSDKAGGDRAGERQGQ